MVLPRPGRSQLHTHTIPGPDWEDCLRQRAKKILTKIVFSSGAHRETHTLGPGDPGEATSLVQPPTTVATVSGYKGTAATAAAATTTTSVVHTTSIELKLTNRTSVVQQTGGV